jgi:hypothetical protein
MTKGEGVSRLAEGGLVRGMQALEVPQLHLSRARTRARARVGIGTAGGSGGDARRGVL